MNEGSLAQGASHLLTTFPKILSCEPPESAEAHRFEEIAQIEIGLFIALALEGKHGVRSRVNRAVNHLCEMHAEEWEVGIWHRIDQCLNQVAFFRGKFVIFAPEGDNFRAGSAPAMRVTRSL